ncbi:MAG: hypothetical protein H7Y04_11900, partial [Verrucomicrobia bacterium]|nr:hypothetical protein [Cytophagales bacterium]
MKIWKSLSIIFVSGFFLLQSVELESCAGGDWEEWTDYRFFNPELTAKPQFRPLFFTLDRLYDYTWDENEDFKRKENLADWQSFFQNQTKATDVEALVYGSNKTQLESIKTFVQNPATALQNVFKNNSAVQVLAQNKDITTLDYLIFAKTCEPFAVQGNEWNTENVPQTANPQMLKLATQAEQKYGSVTNVFLKMRYAYQAVRMAHYAGVNARAIALYDKLVQPLITESVAKYWALGHKAGAIRRQKSNNALAAYLFSLVFDKSESKRINAFYSFRIHTDAEWKQAMALCKNTREKTTLYFMRAIQPNNLMLEEMKNIYALDPSSEYLDVLLVREMNKYEISKGTKNEDLKIFTQKSAGLRAFISQVLAGGKVKNKDLWTLALGYADYLSGKPQEAKKTFASLSGSPAEVKNQLATFDLMVQLAEIQKLDAATEEKLFSQIAATKSEPLLKLMIGVFEELYKKQGETAKMYLSKNSISELKTSPDAKMVESLLLFADKFQQTTYEKVLLAKLGEGITAKENLLEMKATLLMREDKLDEAQAILSKLTIKPVEVEGIAIEGKI